MKKTIQSMIAIALLAMIAGSCSDVPTNSPDSAVTSYAKNGPPSQSANPAIAYTHSFWCTNHGTRTIMSGIHVMDADGSHQTLLYNGFNATTPSASVQAGDPDWSGNGQNICFSGNAKDVYTMGVSLVNGVPTASNVTKLLDATALLGSNGSFQNPVWSPTANEIAVVAHQLNTENKIQTVPSGGGTPTTLFTTPSIYHHLRGLTYSPDGSKIACVMFQGTGSGFDCSILVIDRSTGNTVATIPLGSWVNPPMDLAWSHSSGSTTLVYTVGSSTSSSLSIYTVDYAVSSTPTLVLVNAGSQTLTWSPDDTKIMFGDYNYVIRQLTLSMNAVAMVATEDYQPSWKR